MSIRFKFNVTLRALKNRDSDPDDVSIPPPCCRRVPMIHRQSNDFGVGNPTVKRGLAAVSGNL